MRTTPVRLVACDLDGTLIATGNQLTPRTASAVAAARGAGLIVVAVTGRPWQWTLDLARQHELLPLAVCSNGAAIVDVVTGAVEPTGLADGAVLGLVERARAALPGIVFAVDSVGWMGFEPGFVDGEILGDVQVDDIAPYIAREVVKLIARRPGTDGADLAATLDDAILDGVAVPYHGVGDWVELLAAGVSKASGLAELCRRLGIAAEDVVAVGDGTNDVPMFEWAGTAVAVADARPAALEAADRIVAPSADNGVALLLEELAQNAA